MMMHSDVCLSGWLAGCLFVCLRMVFVRALEFGEGEFWELFLM